MLKELFQEIWQKAHDAITPVSFEDQNGRPYTALGGKLISAVEPNFPTILLGTLTGLVDYAKANKDQVVVTGGLFRVVDPRHVCFHAPCDGDWSQRHTWATASFDMPDQFRFGNYLDLETFIIEVQSRFEDGPERKRLLQLVGSLTAGATSTATDDGITQTVQTKVGVSLKGKASVENPFTLAPFRTFHEVFQPESPFILRVQSADAGVPKVALFESDGGAWKNDAIQSIGTYLNSNLPEGMTVVA